MTKNSSKQSSIPRLYAGKATVQSFEHLLATVRQEGLDRPAFDTIIERINNKEVDADGYVNLIAAVLRDEIKLNSSTEPLFTILRQELLDSNIEII